MYPCPKFQSIWITSDFGTKLPKTIMKNRNFEKINVKIVISNVPLYQISGNLENFRFWGQIFQKNMNDKNFEKNKH